MSPATFGPESLAFLAGLQANNRRDWFAQNKARFEAVVKDPSDHVAHALAEAMAARHPSPMRAKVF